MEEASDVIRVAAAAGHAGGAVPGGTVCHFIGASDDESNDGLQQLVLFGLLETRNCSTTIARTNDTEDVPLAKTAEILFVEGAVMKALGYSNQQEAGLDICELCGRHAARTSQRASRKGLEVGISCDRVCSIGRGDPTAQRQTIRYIYDHNVLSKAKLQMVKRSKKDKHKIRKSVISIMLTAPYPDSVQCSSEGSRISVVSCAF